jgi:hypothetical protein
LLKKLLNIRLESKLLREIKDVRDEIKMINAVLDDQVECLNSSALSHFFEPPRQHTNAKSQLVPDAKSHPFYDAIKFLMEAKADFEVMETDAKKIEEGVSIRYSKLVRTNTSLAGPSHATETNARKPMGGTLVQRSSR